MEDVERIGLMSPDPAVEAGRRRDWRRRAGALASYLALVLALITLNFLLPRAMPGDPIDGLLASGSTVSAEQRRSLEEYYRLDGSLPSQFRHYISRLAHGDLGRSIYNNASVAKEIRRRLPWTALLIGSSILVSTVIGLAAGVHAGWQRDRPVDRLLMTGLLAVREFPTFLLGSLLLFVFAIKLDWVEPFGNRTPFSDTWPLLDQVLDIGAHLVLPMLVLAVGLTAGNYLVMRAGMVNELGADYLLLGRAKGLRPRRLKYGYAARNALLPVVSLTALQVGFAVTGDVLVERVFSYLGLGNLIFEAIGNRDYPVIQGAFLVLSLAVVTLNGLTDLLYRRLDPRTRP